MGSSVNITYVNKSMNMDLPNIFIFMKNEIPTFDCLEDGVAWKVIKDVGRESSCQFVFPIDTEVSSSWNGGSCKTNKLPSVIGNKYIVSKDDTGIVITADGSAGNTRSIDVCNNVHVENGISVDLYKDGRIMMSKNIVGYDQKATFVLHPKLYWGIASEIQEGEQLSSAVLDSDHFFEQNLEGVSNVTIALYGNAQDGYQFKIENQQ
jgi:hypothetical protein